MSVRQIYAMALAPVNRRVLLSASHHLIRSLTKSVILPPPTKLLEIFGWMDRNC